MGDTYKKIIFSSLNDHLSYSKLKLNYRSHYNLPNSAFWGWLSMERQPQNPEFRNNPENFYPCVCVFNVPPTAKIIWRRGHGLKSHLTDWWSWEWSLLVYKASGLSTTPQGLLLLPMVISKTCLSAALHALNPSQLCTLLRCCVIKFFLQSHTC